MLGQAKQPPRPVLQGVVRLTAGGVNARLRRTGPTTATGVFSTLIKDRSSGGRKVGMGDTVPCGPR